MSESGESERGRRRPGPRRRHGSPVGPDAVRRAVLDAAADLFARRGIDAVSLREVAKAADVQLALIARYIGTRAELIDAVFTDLSNKLARELTDQPREQISFERESTMGRWTILLAHLVVTSVDLDAATTPFNPVQAMARVLQEGYGLEPRDARIRGAQIAAMALGWRMFERYLVAAGDLGSIPIGELHDELTALNRHIGATPLSAPPDSPLADG